MGSFGVPELLLIGGVFILLFGGKRVAEFGKGFGDSIREFKRAVKDDGKKEDQGR